MLSSHLATYSSCRQARLIKVGCSRDDKRISDTIAAQTLIVRSQTEFIEIDSNLTDWEFYDNRITVKCKDANWWIDTASH